MSPFAALKRLFTSGTEGVAKVGDPFIQLDREAIAKKLRLKERAIEEGSLNQPAATETVFDAVETDIEAEISRHHIAAQIDLRNQLQAYENRLSGLKLLHETGRIKSEAVTATGDFETLVRDWRNRIALDKREVRDAYLDLQEFKKKHGLRRPARDVPSGVVTYGIIAVAGLIEVLGNAIFLRVNDDLGYLGGVIGAIVVSVINIIIAFGFGRFLIPLKNLTDPLKKFIGTASIFVWLALALFWNLLAAHYRDAKYAGFENPEAGALEQMFSNAFALDGIFSLGIFVIGIFVSAVVLLDAYRMDDPFPGYGQKSREFRERCEGYGEEVALAHQELTAVRDDAINGANQVKSQLGVQFGERGNIKRAYDRYVERFRQHEDHLELITSYLLSAYRNANKKARSNPDDVPRHFSENYELVKSEVEPLHLLPLNERDIQAAEAALDDCIEAVKEAFGTSVSQFTPLEELISELDNEPL